jgi:hypothetical protein
MAGARRILAVFGHVINKGLTSALHEKPQGHIPTPIS